MLKSLGNLEEVLLLLVAIMNGEEIYGFSVMLEYQKQMGNPFPCQPFTLY